MIVHHIPFIQSTGDTSLTAKQAESAATSLQVPVQSEGEPTSAPTTAQLAQVSTSSPQVKDCECTCTRVLCVY